MMNVQFRRKNVAWLLLILGLLLVAAAPTYSQTVGGALSGTITDNSGAVMEGVSVTITNVATGVVTNVRTTSVGYYTAPTLTPGNYDVKATMQGFKTQVRSGIILTVDASEIANLKMAIGSASEVVNVIGAAPIIDLTSSTLGGVVDSKTIVALPLNGRDWTQLATLEPGVGLLQAQVGGLGSPAAPGGRAARGNGAQMIISGGRPQENDYRLDGINIDDYAQSAPGSVLGLNLGVDAVEEFSVLTSNYGAQYGRGSGGVINAVTRNGTNAFHGGAYEFLRNSALDTRNYFDAQKPEFRRNQFGASTGGPIRRDKTFFFTDYEGFRETLGSSTLDLVPSANARMGILSTGNVTVDPAVVPYLALWPLPNGTLLPGGDVGQFSISTPQISHEDYVIGRVDHTFSVSDSISGTYTWDNGNISSGDEFNNKPNLLKSRRQNASLGENHIFSSSVLNSARVGMSRTATQHGIISQVYNPILKDPAYGFIPNLDIGLIGVQGITGFSGGLGNDDGDTYWYTSIQASDDVYVTKGIHSIKFGATVERINLNENSPSAEEGDWEFNSLSDFLTNHPYTFKGAIPPSVTEVGLHQTVFGTYAQDDIRVRPNFTANLGLRYEMSTIPAEVHGHSAPLFEVSAPQATVGPFFKSNPTLTNFEPRVGFAWDPFKNNKTSVRAGFGMYDVLPLPYLFHQITNSAPFWQGGQVTTPAGTFPKQGFPILGPTSGQGWYTEPNPKRAYKMQWNFSIQRELAPSTALTVAFVGSRGVHLVYHNAWINTVIPTLTPQGWLFPPPGTPVLNPNFGRIVALLFRGNSFYDGLQVGLNKQLSHGLSAQLSYTWSKSIDDSSSSFDGEEFNNSVNDPLPFDPKYNRAVSDFNLPQVFVGSFLWAIPTPSSWFGDASWLARGWQLGGIFTSESGTPFTPLLAGDRAGSQMDGHSAQRPVFNAIPGCSPNAINPGNVANYIKTQCFSFPPAGLIPNNTIGRNTLIGPKLNDLDLSVFKNIPIKRISDQFQMQFRTEAFNALNHTNFQPPYNNNVVFDNGGNIESGVGFIQGTQTASRQIQFGLKLLW
jgi:hypothetical protein